MITSASITIYKEKVYLPVIGKTYSGLFVDTNPVFICNPILEEMVINLNKVQEIGHPNIEINSSEDRLKHVNIMLKATATKSWKELARLGYCYTLGWSTKGTLLEMSRMDKQGRWEYDPLKTKRLPLDTPYNDLIQVILDDYHSR